MRREASTATALPRQQIVRKGKPIQSAMFWESSDNIVKCELTRVQFCGFVLCCVYNNKSKALIFGLIEALILNDKIKSSFSMK